jgi:hypothetical protein
VCRPRLQALRDALRRNEEAEARFSDELQALTQAEERCKCETERLLRGDEIKNVKAALDRLKRQKQNIQDRLDFYVRRVLPNTYEIGNASVPCCSDQKEQQNLNDEVGKASVLRAVDES